MLSEAQNEPITNGRCLIVVTSAPTSSTMPTHSCPEGTDHRDAFVVSWAFSSDLLGGGSCHAELVAFRGQHDYVVEDPRHSLPAQQRRRVQQARAPWLGSVAPAGDVPRTFTATRMSIWSPFFADFPSGTRSHPIAGALPSGSMVKAPSGSS